MGKSNKPEQSKLDSTIALRSKNISKKKVTITEPAKANQTKDKPQLKLKVKKSELNEKNFKDLEARESKQIIASIEDYK